MKFFLYNYFHFSRRERRGIVILIALIITLFVLPYVVQYIQSDLPVPVLHNSPNAIAATTVEPSEKKENVLFYFNPNTLSKDSLLLLGLPAKTASTIINYRKKIGRFAQAEDLKKIYTLSTADYDRLIDYVYIPEVDKPTTPSPKPRIATEKVVELVNFDPNTASKQTLETLGLSKRVVSTILNYRQKGGQFKQKQDLQKIYGLSVADYERLSPYIVIVPKPADAPIAQQTTTSTAPSTYDKTPRYEEVIIDINAATIDEWQKLRGIGPSYAKRITNFREKLGGFYDVYQVKSTYGLPDSTFQKILPFLRESAVYRTIPINTATAEELKSHPYISWKIANVIVKYRNQHGAFKNFDDLRKIKALQDDFLQKIGAYLSFE